MSDEKVGDYRLLQRLGEGAAGEVHLATPTLDKAFAKRGEPVALKRYKPDILKQVGQLKRIHQEFTAGSTLAHPNLVRMYEYSTEPKVGPPYLVMEYVDGLSLDNWIEMFHPLPGRLLLKIVDQLLGALTCLHDAGEIHRDLKPQNIMVSSSFDAKLMDLGVVRITNTAPLTPKDKFVGTIRNSSPELLFGEEYDHRTDLYSLGTVLYMLLYGEQVFPNEGQFARLIDLIKRETPRFDPSVGNRDQVSDALLRLAHALLDKDPAKRPSTAKEVRTSLEPIRALLPTQPSATPLHGYVATALTGLAADARDAIAFTSSKIAHVAKEYDLYVYQPRRATDPLLHPDVDPTAVYLKDRSRVINADVLLLLANQPSFGVGQELEIAASYGKPTIIIAREGTRISRMVTGSFANILGEVIYYQTPEDLERKLRNSLAANLGSVREAKQKRPPRPLLESGSQIASLRQKAGYATSAELAHAMGVSPRLAAAIEAGDYQNVGMVLLWRVSQVLGVPVRDLVDTSSTAPSPVRTKDPNIDSLERVARKLAWPANDFFDLRSDYLQQVAADGEGPILAEGQWRDRHHALEQRKLANPAEEHPQPTLFDDPAIKRDA